MFIISSFLSISLFTCQKFPHPHLPGPSILSKIYFISICVPFVLPPFPFPFERFSFVGSGSRRELIQPDRQLGPGSNSSDSPGAPRRFHLEKTKLKHLLVFCPCNKNVFEAFSGLVLLEQNEREREQTENINFG